MNNPFGDTITPESIIDTLSFFDDWESRYKYIIDLGKELPAMPDELHTQDRVVKGCQSLVWIDSCVVDGRFQFNVDSDAHIVKGLLAILMAAVNNKSSADIMAFDMEAYFQEIDLVKHISPTRGNGLRAMVNHIFELVQA